jgi:hypothetical protein
VVNLEKTANDSIKFRVNLYDLKDGVPNKSKLSEPIYYFDKPKNGKITIDVSELNIYIKEDCFLSVELIEIFSAMLCAFSAVFYPFEAGD